MGGPEPAGAARKLSLGTAQFGLKYGIASPAQRLSPAEACEVLRLAHERGITMLDTAPAYGDSEAVLGRCLARSGDRFAVVTKAQPVRRTALGPADLKAVSRGFTASLQRLGRASVYGVLVHHAPDLLASGGERLYELLAGWRARGQARKIGVSVYGRAEVDALVERYQLDVVQLPLSVFDQRLAADGTLRALKRMNVEVHARSVFLQGLALMDPASLPGGFDAARPVVARFRDALTERGLSPVAGALAYIGQLPEVDRIVFGVHSAAQLMECIAACDAPATDLDFSRFACTDEQVLDPRRWLRGPGA